MAPKALGRLNNAESRCNRVAVQGIGEADCIKKKFAQDNNDVKEERGDKMEYQWHQKLWVD